MYFQTILLIQIGMFMMAMNSIKNDSAIRTPVLKNVKTRNKIHAGRVKKILRYFFCIFVIVAAHLGSNPKNFY